MSAESGYCKFCGKPLLWVTTNNGARMPLDKEESVMRWVTDATTNPMSAKMRKTYTSHMDTCTKKGKVEDEREGTGKLCF